MSTDPTSETRPADGPLRGVRVLDLGTLLAGPVAATLLGDMGAEVIKIEQPGVGDPLRGGPTRDGDPPRLYWLVEGRNKRSITINLREPAGQDLVRRLAAEADVLIENFTPGTLDGWGLGWDDLHEVNPGLIMVRVSGFGQTGPYSKRAGYDRIALGVSGYLYPTGYPDRPPGPAGLPDRRLQHRDLRRPGRHVRPVRARRQGRAGPDDRSGPL